jgi:hypothetical protein
MTGFIGLFDTARDYTLQFTITHTHAHTHTHTHTGVHSHIFISRFLVAASKVDVLFPRGSPKVPNLSYQFLTTAHNDRNTAVRYLTH